MRSPSGAGPDANMKRLSASEALAAGADFLVDGRPILADTAVLPANG